MKIAPPLVSFAVPVEELHLMEGNPRRGDVDGLARKLARFGQRIPIVYRNEPDPDTGESRKVVYAGNHRLRAVRQLGWEQIAAISGDDMTHDEIRAFSIADNRSSDVSDYDDGALLSMLQDMAAQDADMLTDVGYTEADLDTLLAAVQKEEPSEPVEGLLPDDLEAGEFEPSNTFAVTILCDDEQHQQKIYSDMVEQGFECRVVTV